MPVTLQQIADFLSARTNRRGYEHVSEVWRAGARPVQRLGVALELLAGMDTDGLDALLLQRPFRLPPDALPGAGILVIRGALEAHLTMGYNPALAEALGIGTPRPVQREGEIVGMTGWLAEPEPWDQWEARVQGEFGGLEASAAHGVRDVAHVAVMNGMHERLIVEMADAGIDTYLTSAIRVSGSAAAAERHMALIAPGETRVERWGLRRLARDIERAFPELSARVLG
jgi:hypothetical protein